MNTAAHCGNWPLHPLQMLPRLRLLCLVKYFRVDSVGWTILQIVVDAASLLPITRVAHAMRYGCYRRSNLVILFKPEDDISTGLRLALTSRRFCSSRVLTAAMFCSVLAVLRLPELPLLRLRPVPWLEYFLTFLKIVVLWGGSRSGNLAWKAFLHCYCILRLGVM